jgi:hypothetical protein
MERRRLAALIALAAILLVAAWPLVEQDGTVAPTTEPPVAEAPKRAVTTPPSAVEPAKKREPIPRPRRVERSAAPPAPATTGQKLDTGIEKGGVDRSLTLDAGTLKSVADRMRPSISACVEAWTAEVPQIEGRVVLGWDLGPDGVQTAWIEEHEDVPVGVLGCFSAAVYEQDWPPAPDGVRVTFPFVVEAGLVPEEPGGALEDKR